MKIPEALTKSGPTTILAYGALLSESSSRLTFPALSNFRLVRVKGFRRVFAHPHTFLLSQKLIDPLTSNLRLASLSAEKAEEDAGFTAAAFEVDLDDTQREAFVAREKEYNIVSIPYYNIISSTDASDDNSNNQNSNEVTTATSPSGHGVICLASTDDQVSSDYLTPLLKILQSSPDNEEGKHSLWHWSHASGLLPADIYLRHILLAVKKAPGKGEAERSFLEESYLADRKTTIAEYLALNNNQDIIMKALPPEDLMTRFNG